MNKKRQQPDTAVVCPRCEHTKQEMLEAFRNELNDFVVPKFDKFVARTEELVAKCNDLAGWYEELRNKYDALVDERDKLEEERDVLIEERDGLLEERDTLQWEQQLQEVYDRRERQRARENAACRSLREAS